MTKEELLANVEERLQPFGKLMYLTKHGSHLYGTNTENSDEDYVGVFIANKDYQLGFKNVEEVDCSIVDKDESGKNTKDAVDIKIYELKKFLNLTLAMNPNIVDLYFSHTNSDAIIFNNGELDVFFNNPEWFVNERLLMSFMGYAKSQMKKGRNKPHNYEVLKLFGKLLDTLMKNSFENHTLGEFRSDIEKLGVEVDSKQIQVNNLTFPTNYFVKKVHKMVHEKLTSVSHRSKEWSEKGYDSKFFMHLFRLLDEGTKLATENKIEFPLENRQFYLDVRNGKFTLDELEEMVETKFNEFKKLESNVNLPKKAKMNIVEKEMLKIIETDILGVKDVI